MGASIAGLGRVAQAPCDRRDHAEFNEGIIRTVPVPLLPIREQHRIAGILSAFDEKIELNSRMADNLEAVARATFRSTFVSARADQRIWLIHRTFHRRSGGGARGSAMSHRRS